MSEYEIIDLIHLALCESSPDECKEYFGDCYRAGSKVWLRLSQTTMYQNALIKGENK